MVLSITAIAVLGSCAKDVPTIPAELELPWVEVESPRYKGTVRSMAIGDDGTVYLGAQVRQAGADPSIILISNDGGETWRENHIGMFWILSLTIDSKGYIFATGYGWKVWRSKDGGETWESFDQGFPERNTEVYSFIGPDDEIILWGESEGIFMSTDAGDTWESLGDTLMWDWTRFLAGTQDFRFFASTYDGLFFSDDTCASWEGPVEGPWEGDTPNKVLVLSDGTLILHARRVCRSHDNGETWETIIDDRNTADQIWKDDLDRLYYVDNGILMMSVDMGTTWVYQMEAIENSHRVQIGSGPSGEIFVSTGRNGAGFCRSVDGGTTWEYLGLAEGDPETIHWGSDGRLYVCMPCSGIFRTDASDISWECFSDKRDLLFTYSLAERLNGELLAGTFFGIYSSQPEEMCWASLGSYDFNYEGITAMIEVPGRGIFAGSYGRGIYHLPDGEDMWLRFGLNDYDITSLVMTDSLGFYASCSFGGVFSYDEETFVWDQTNEGLGDLNVEALVLTPDGRLVAGTKYSGLYVMNPAERIWRKLGSEELHVVAMDIYNETVVIGTDYDGFYFFRTGMDGPEQIPVGDGGDIAGFGNYPYLTSMSIGPEGYIAFLSRDRVFMSLCPID